MICGYCGTELPDSALFCGECGRSLAQVASASRRLRPVVLPPAVRAEPPVDVPEPDLPVVDPEPLTVDPELAEGEPDTPAREPTETAPATPATSHEFDSDPDVDATRIVPPSTIERFVLQFSTGESVTVTGNGLIGRNPVAEPGEYFDHLVTIVDPGKSVSKTHLEFGQEAGGFWVSDRFSGNGTIARQPEGEPIRCDPGKRYRVTRGSRVSIGEQFFVIS